MRVWVTKWVLGRGIEVAEDAKVMDGWYIKYTRTVFPICVHRKHWHETEAAAKEAADGILARRITGLKKQIANLEQRRAELKQPTSGGES